MCSFKSTWKPRRSSEGGHVGFLAAAPKAPLLGSRSNFAQLEMHDSMLIALAWVQTGTDPQHHWGFGSVTASADEPKISAAINHPLMNTDRIDQLNRVQLVFMIWKAQIKYVI